HEPVGIVPAPTVQKIKHRITRRARGAIAGRQNDVVRKLCVDQLALELNCFDARYGTAGDGKRVIRETEPEGKQSRKYDDRSFHLICSFLPLPLGKGRGEGLRANPS